MLRWYMYILGMHPRVLVDGFDIAKRATLQFLEKFKTPVVMGGEPDKEILKMVARTTVRTKVKIILSYLCFRWRFIILWYCGQFLYSYYFYISSSFAVVRITCRSIDRYNCWCSEYTLKCWHLFWILVNMRFLFACCLVIWTSRFCFFIGPGPFTAGCLCFAMISGFMYSEAWGRNWSVYGGDHAYATQIWCWHTLGIFYEWL